MVILITTLLLIQLFGTPAFLHFLDITTTTITATAQETVAVLIVQSAMAMASVLTVGNNMLLTVGQRLVLMSILLGVKAQRGLVK